jgi:hypothetical protein
MRGLFRAWSVAAFATCLVIADPAAAQGLADVPDLATLAEPQTIAIPARSTEGDMRRPLLTDTVTRVLKDPTTYALPPIVYTAHRLDWDSSQKLFAYGYLEANPDFTVTGRVDDLPISHEAGKKKILRYAAGTIGRSVLNNAASAIVERRLIERYPHRRKLIRTLGWIERSLVTTYWSYRLTHNQVRQWQDNERTLAMLRAQGGTR